MTILSIIVLSYNRPKGLKRILQNFTNYENSLVNIIIKDDRSPLQNEISEIVENFKKILKISLRLHLNDKNLGYDLNLLDSFAITDSDYIFLLSDDDYLNPASLDKLVEILTLTKYKILFSPFIFNNKEMRNKIKKYDETQFADIIYNSILFSGLIFDRKAVLKLDIDLKLLSNSIYSQVFLAGMLSFKYKSYGVAPSNMLTVGGDGENFFGKNDSAINKEILQNRDTVFADLNYQQFLLKTVDYLSLKTDVSIGKIFWRSYRIRLIGMGFKTRSLGISNFLDFLKAYFKFGIRRSLFASIVFVFLIVCPKIIAINIYNFSVSVLRNSG